MKRTRHYINERNEPGKCYHCFKPLTQHRWEVYIGTKQVFTCSEIHANDAYYDHLEKQRRLERELHLV